MTIKTLGIDLGKRCFHVHGTDSKGNAVFKRKFTRQKLLLFLSNLEPCLIGFEACGGAHHWAKKANSFGHTAKLMPAQFVKPYVKSNKNDFLDAEAICEAVQRPTMRFVTIRTDEQQALGAMIKLRARLVRQRNATINQVHGFLLEFGIEYPKGRKTVAKLMEIISLQAAVLPPMMHSVLCRLYEEYRHLCSQLEELEDSIEQAVRTDDRGQRLLAVPGVGVITAACLLAWVGDGKQFSSGRQLAAWIGLVPKQYSTGGKAILKGIGKRGHTLLRCNLIHGARSALQWCLNKPGPWQAWASQLLKEKAKPLVVVALANKLARMIWVILAHNQHYTPLPRLP